MVMRVPLAMLNAPDTPAALRRLEVGARDVADVDEIARLLAVAVDRDRLAVQHAVSEDRNDVAVGVVPLVHAVDVEITQTDAFERVELRVRQAQLLAASLLAPYGVSGSIGWSSRIGSVLSSPKMPAEEE